MLFLDSTVWSNRQGWANVCAALQSLRYPRKPQDTRAFWFHCVCVCVCVSLWVINDFDAKSTLKCSQITCHRATFFTFCNGRFFCHFTIQWIIKQSDGGDFTQTSWSARCYKQTFVPVAHHRKTEQVTQSWAGGLPPTTSSFNRQNKTTRRDRKAPQASARVTFQFSSQILSPHLIIYTQAAAPTTWGSYQNKSTALKSKSVPISQLDHH